MWSPPPRTLSLNAGSLHIWRAPLLPGPPLNALAGEILSEKEKARCARFVRAEDRARCEAGRAVLRVVLSKYVSLAPRAIPILEGEAGKPYLDGIGGIQFNVSHAGDLLQVAVCRDARVGIDIERIRDVRGMSAVVDDFFDEEERACVRSSRGNARSRVFFRLWTRREAAAKAMGLDLFDAFARCQLPAFKKSRSGFRLVLSLNGSPTGGPPGGPPGARGAAPAAWWIRDFTPAPGYAGALCVQRENAAPSFYHLGSW